MELKIKHDIVVDIQFFITNSIASILDYYFLQSRNWLSKIFDIFAYILEWDDFLKWCEILICQSCHFMRYSKNLYQVLLGIYLCKCWTVIPRKSNMSEGCWLFTLKMAVQSSWHRDFTFWLFQTNLKTGKLVKSTYH